jgi:hypothetical protein
MISFLTGNVGAYVRPRNLRSIGAEVLARHYIASDKFRSISNVARISAGVSMHRVLNVSTNPGQALAQLKIVCNHVTESSPNTGFLALCVVFSACQKWQPSREFAESLQPVCVILVNAQSALALEPRATRCGCWTSVVRAAARP